MHTLPIYSTHDHDRAIRRRRRLSHRSARNVCTAASQAIFVRTFNPHAPVSVCVCPSEMTSSTQHMLMSNKLSTENRATSEIVHAQSNWK